MGRIAEQQPASGSLRESLNACPRCGHPLLMFGCDNPRCENCHGNKRFFYHEIIKTQAEIDKEYELLDSERNRQS